MDPDLRDLLSAWLGNEMEPGRLEQLRARVCGDAAFRQAFAAEVWMLGTLKVVQVAEPRWLRLEDEIGWSAAEPLSGDSLEDQVLGRLPLSEPARRSPALRGARWAAAAVIVLGTLLGAWSWSRRVDRGKDPGAGARGPLAAARPYPRVDTESGLAMVIRLDGVRWEPGSGPHPAEGDILAPGRLRLRSGRLTLSMLTGVALAVEGPADIELVSDDKVVCRQGRMRVRSTAGERGFAVRGPDLAVLDLGTEFGVNIGRDGTARARVFDGRVESVILGADGTPQRTRSFVENEEFEIDPTAGAIAPLRQSDEFVGPTELVPDPLELAPDYPAVVRRSRPWGYWRFEAIDQETFPNEIAGRPALRIVGPVRLAAGPDGAHCAEFTATRGRQNLELDDLWQPPWSSGFAVELWVLSRRIGHTTLVSMTAPHDSNNHLLLLELTSRNLLHRPASIRLLHRWPPGGAGGDNLYTREPYVPYRWHHVVGQYRDDRMELYVNGEALTPLPVDPDHRAETCRILLGRLTTRPGTGISIDRPLVGRMDELALYDHPLSGDEVRTHYRLGAQRTSPAPSPR